MKKNSLSLLITFFLFSLLMGCSSSLSNTQFYLLPEPKSTSLEEQSKEETKYIAVLPVLIPSYLERSEILLKSKNSTSLVVAQNRRWAESLDSMLQRLVAVSLSNEIMSSNTIAFPLNSTFPVDYKLSVDISLFEGNTNNEASVNAYWVLREENKTLAQGKFIKSMPVSASFEELLEVQSLLIQEMTMQIAEEYNKL